MGPPIEMRSPKSASSPSEWLRLMLALDQGACVSASPSSHCIISCSSPVTGQKTFSSNRVKSGEHLPEGATRAKCLRDGWSVEAQLDPPSCVSVTLRLIPAGCKTRRHCWHVLVFYATQLNHQERLHSPACCL